jgi:hypothetical protein
MRFRLAVALVVAALAAPAAHASPPIPPLEDVLKLFPAGTTVEDYCVWEVGPDGRRKVVCAPSGRLPELQWEIVIPRT